MRYAAAVAVAPAPTLWVSRSRRRPLHARADAASDGSSSTSAHGRGPSRSAALEASLRLAAVRAAEQRQPLPLFADALSLPLLDAAAAAGAAGPPPGAAESADAQRDVLATRFLDEQLLKAVNIVNLERDLTQEYNQVVLVGDAFDTRPYRLPWPEGTVIYLVAPADVHRAADAAAKALGARVPRGCLLRRVPAELYGEGGEGFAAALERAGLRGDRLSAWVLQGLDGLSPAALSALFTDLCNLAAFDSLVAGMLPAMQRRSLNNLLASFGLLGTGVDFGEQTDWGRWEARLALDAAAARPWLFVAQQKRLSLQEMGIYEDHVAAAQEVDEDFFGNFS